MLKDECKIALVTGASSGIGKALVVELLVLGYEVIGIARFPEKLKEEIRNPLLSVYSCDVANLEAVRVISAKLKQAGKIPQFFFLNAGILGQAAMEEKFDVEHHRHVFAVNYFGVLNFVQEWLGYDGVTFIVSSSIVSIFAPPKRSAYSASKAAISKAFDSLRLTQRNQKFLSVFIPPVDTPGLSAKLPFIWPAKRMAKYMIKKAKKGKARSYPSWLFTIISRFLNILPDRCVVWLMQFEKER